MIQAPETLFDRVKRHEGFTFRPKPDAKGMWEIGHGHDITPAEALDYANGISEDDADDLLHEDLARARYEVNRALPWTQQLSPLRQEVLIEMAFQMGISGLLGFHTLLSCVRSGDFAGAAHSMLASRWHTETPTRCEELANIMLNDTANP